MLLIHFRALKEGHWLLIEDADKAPPDLSSLLVGFLNEKFVKVNPQKDELLRQYCNL